jgi:hypothetical protein
MATTLEELEKRIGSILAETSAMNDLMACSRDRQPEPESDNITNVLADLIAHLRESATPPAQDASARVAELGSELAAARRERNDAQDRLKACGDSGRALAEKLTASEAREAALQDEIKGTLMWQQCQNLQADLSRVKAERDKAVAELQDEHRHCDSMRDKLRRAEEELSRLRASQPAGVVPDDLRAILDVVVKGGTIVSSNACSVVEIAAARACHRFYVDPNYMGYVARPATATPLAVTSPLTREEAERLANAHYTTAINGLNAHAQLAYLLLRIAAEARRDALEEASSQLGCLSRWIVSRDHGPADHACARCVPDGPIVIAGFVCARHLAHDIQSALATPAPAAKEGT